jgi:hypothetical protein
MTAGVPELPAMYAALIVYAASLAVETTRGQEVRRRLIDS